jgi:hypothetical protein
VTKRRLYIILAVAACFGAGMVFAQNRSAGPSGTSGRGSTRQSSTRQSSANRQSPSSGISGRGFSGRDSLSQEMSSQGDIFKWEINKEFASDVFTFVRVRYSSSGGPVIRPVQGITRSKWFPNDPPVTGPCPFPSGWRYRSGGGWGTDYPTSDNNFSYRLHQLTSIQVNPNPIALALTSPELCNYPFLYMCDPGYSLNLTQAEVKALRTYLLNGGFLWMDDFWGDNEWENVYNQMKKVFPEFEPVELGLDHPIFNCVFVLKKKPQCLNISYAINGRAAGVTWERPDARNPHYMAINDDKGRLMVLMSLNSDTGDGWEREGQDEWFFHTFSESQCYPLGINVVFYVLTH